MKNQITDFESIRPYQDSQVSEIIDTLIKDKKFHKTLSSQLYPKLSKIAPFIARTIFKRIFK